MKRIDQIRILSLVVAFHVGFIQSSANAAIRTWSGAGADANWGTAANWGGTAPVNADSLVFSGTTQQNNTNNIASLSLGFVTFNNGGFVLNGNTINNSGSANAFFTNTTGINTVACPMIMTAPGGRYWFISPSSELRLTGTVTNTAASGTSVGWLNLTNGGTVRIMNTAKSTRGMDLFQGTVIVDGSSALVDAFNDGFRLKPPTGFTVAVQITNNGTIRIGAGGNFRMGHNGTGIGGIAGPGSFCRVDMSSGLFELYGSAANILVGDLVAGSISVFNQNGGTVWGSAGSGNAITIGNSANADGTYNLNGGILWIGQVKQGNTGATNVVFNFNGGTLKPTGSSTNFMQGLLTANVLSGGAIIDTTNFNITIGQNLSAGSLNGGLTKLGSGALVLTGSSSYTGSTIVSNGMLILAGPMTGGGAITVADGAGLGFTNSGSSITVPSLTVGSSLASTLQFSFPNGNPGSASVVAGSFTGNGNITVNITGSGLTAGSFDLVDFTSGSGLANFHIGSTPPGVSATLVTTSTSLRLNISSVVKSLQWSSTPADSEWNTTSINWLDLGNGSAPSTYSQSGGFGDMVTFSSSGTTAIDVPTTVTPVSMTVDSSAPDYTFTGVGKISGVGNLTMNSFSHLTLGTVNDYSGGTIINAGIVCAGADQALGTGPVTININGTLCSDSTTAHTLSNYILQTADVGIYFGDATRTGPLTLAGGFDLGGGLTRTLNFNSDIVISGTMTNGGFNTKTGTGGLIIKGNSVQNGLSSQQQGNVVIDGGKFVCGNGWRLQNTLPSSTINLIITNGGVMNVAAFINTGNMRVGLSGGDSSANNILDIASGTLDMTPTNGIVNNNGVSLGGGGANDIMYLRSGGLLITRSLFGAAPDTTSDAHFMGGTIRALANDPGLIVGLTNAFMEDGGLTVDTTNFSATIPQPLIASGSGGLTKIGAGTLTLTGASTYTGPTTVNAGKLVLGPAFSATGNIIVNASSTLAFLQSAAPATVNLPSVTIGSGANSALEAELSVTNAPTAIITNLTLNGTVAVNVTGTFGAGQFPLFGYGTISGPGQMVLGSVPFGTIGSIVTNVPNKTIDLLVSGIAQVTWTGATNSNWDLVTTNWTVLGTPVAYVQSANVQFNDSATNANVSLSTTLTPSSVAVSNTALAYQFNGAGSLSGSMTLTKNGTNSLTMNNSDTFIGNVNINGGTLVLGSATALGSISNNVYITNGTLDFSGKGIDGQPIVAAGAGVNGGGALINSGADQNDALSSLTLTANTTIGGTGQIGLRTGADTDLGLVGNGYKLIKVGSSGLNINGGKTNNSLTHVWTTDLGNVDIQAGTLSFQRRSALGNPTNTISVWPGATLSLFSLNQSLPVPTNSIVMTNGILNGTGSVGDVNTLGGSVSLNGSSNIINVTVWVGTTGPTLLQLNGPIIGTGSVIYSGSPTGTIALAGINTYTGSTVVSNGTLALTASSALAGTPSIALSGAATLDVSAVAPWNLTVNQTLTGSGTNNGSIVANGTISPGDGIATLTFNNNLTLAGTNLMELNKNNVGQTNDILAVNGTLTCGGTLNVTVTGGTLVAGDSFKLFNAGSLTGGFTTVNLPSGYTWDTSQLGVSGVITVTAATSRSHPVFTTVMQSGGSIVLGGTNASGSYVLYSSTNLALPLASWTPVFTNSFSGSFSFTNTADGPQKFYLLQ